MFRIISLESAFSITGLLEKVFTPPMVSSPVKDTFVSTYNLLVKCVSAVGAVAELIFPVPLSIVIASTLVPFKFCVPILNLLSSPFYSIYAPAILPLFINSSVKNKEHIPLVVCSS